MMPKVSVIIPVYNSERYLRECVDSVLEQSLPDIEVLCVDDGSTDSSYNILSEYAEKDKRIRIFQQDNSGAGVARNYGLAMAKGEYLSFLDSDDFVEPCLLEEAYNRCSISRADICFFKARLFYQTSRKTSDADWMLKTDLLPQNTFFHPDQLGSNLFFFTTPVPWDRLYRRKFVVDHGLKFQALKRANDLLFTYLSLIRAQRITVLPKHLIFHRVGMHSNLQATNHETPLDFYRALSALKKELIHTGEYQKYERAFVNEVVRHCLYNLKTLKKSDAFIDLFLNIKKEFFPSLDINDRDETFFLTDDFYKEYQKIKTLSPEAYLFDKVLALQSELSNHRHLLSSARTKSESERIKAEKAEGKRRAAEEKANRIRASVSFRTGYVITALPRVIVRAFKRISGIK